MKIDTVNRDFRGRQISLPTKSKMAPGGHIEYIKMAITCVTGLPINAMLQSSMGCSGMVDLINVKHSVSKIPDGGQQHSWVH